MLAYVVMFSFFGYYWKNQIWRAVKGFNGKIQLIELMKLGAIVAMFAHWIEWIFGEKEFSWEATLMFSAIAIASQSSKIDLGGIINRMAGSRNAPPIAPPPPKEEEPKVIG